MENSVWKERPIRMVRFDLLGQMLAADPQALERHARLVREELHANFEWVMGTPGAAPGLAYLANFQTPKLEVNPAIGDTDPIRTYVPIARKAGITLFAYLNMHWYSYTFADQHPDWEQRLADGTGYGRKFPLYGDGTTLCVNSGWRDFAFDMIEEAMKTGIDGVFLDGPVVYPGCCTCDACGRKFREQTGAELPEEDWRNPLWKSFLRFREDSMADFLRDARVRVRKVNPQGGIFLNAGNWAYGNAVARNPWVLEDHQDLTGAEAFFHLRKEGVPYLLDSSQAAKFLRAGKNPALVFTHHALGVWHYLGLSPLELKRAFYQSAACGANNWFAVFWPALEHQREKTLKPVSESYGFLEQHEDLFVGTASAARTALVHSQATSLSYLSPHVSGQAEAHEQDLVMHTRGADIADMKARKRACDQLCGEEFSGFFYALTRNHIPFDVVRDVDVYPKTLEHYDTVILPNTACLGEEPRQALLDYVHAGGRVIASFETGQYDAEGHGASGAFLKALFGIEVVEGAFSLAAYEEYMEIAPEGAALLEGFAAGELVPRYRSALKVRPTQDAIVLCYIMAPIGQVYAPLKPKTEYPGILVKPIGKGYGIYIAGTFGESYHNFGFLEYEEIFAALVNHLPGSVPQIETDAPSTVQMELWRKGRRLLLHLVNNSGDMRRPMKVIHPVPELHITLSGIRADHVRTAREVPVAFRNEDRGVALSLALEEQYDIVVIDVL